MTNPIKRKGRRLSHEILGLLVITFVISLPLFFLLSALAVAVIEGFLSAQDIQLTGEQLAVMDGWVFNLSLLFTVGFFVILFLFLLGERLSYIRDIIVGIDALRQGQQDYMVPLEGCNELTQLAEAINYLSATQMQIKEKERVLNEEKEQLIRTLSHDIRTPLTSILAYSELLLTRTDCTHQEQREHLALIRKKAEQIKDLTDILLDGGKRNPERFEDAQLLMEQLGAEFQEALEEEYSVTVDLSGCTAFSGTFDVQELRRISDNLITNVQKYADPGQPVTLSLSVEEDGLVIRQRNHISPRRKQIESHQMGLNSIRRIAHNYGGRAVVRQADGIFEITITLSEI